MNDPSLISRWRLVTSADDEHAAEAAGTSLLASLLVGERVDLSIAPYFKGGFQVEFALTHEEPWESAEAWLLSSVERTCVEWRQVHGLDGAISLWSHALNIPRAEALEVVMSTSDP